MMIWGDQAVIVGIILSSLIFAVKYSRIHVIKCSRIHVIKYTVTRRYYQSNVIRNFHVDWKLQQLGG